MIVFERVAEMRDWVIRQRRLGRSVSFVPTMGALHPGHISLINKARGETDVVVASVFVNPTQFNNAEDLEKYPRTLQDDMRLLQEAQCDALFCPSVAEMYPDGQRIVPVDYGNLTNRFEAAHRPGHFDGVVAIVRKLFYAVPADRAYFGEKDMQQLRVIQTLVEREEIPIQIVPCPTMRESSGLAMSSRNVRLSEEGRKKASMIFNALKRVASVTTLEALREMIPTQIRLLEGATFKVEYLSVVNKTTFEASNNVEEHERVVLFAGVLEGVRLIDNLSIAAARQL
jgi:pantoate--beta-alanine ligase